MYLDDEGLRHVHVCVLYLCPMDDEDGVGRCRNRRQKSVGASGLGKEVLELCEFSSSIPTRSDAGCAVFSLLRFLSVMTSETLARVGTRSGLVVLEVRGPKERRMTGCCCPWC